MSVYKKVTPGLYLAAYQFVNDATLKPDLESAALRYAINRLRRTGEKIAGIPDALALLEQLADDQCAGHCDIMPMCVEHEL